MQSAHNLFQLNAFHNLPLIDKDLEQHETITGRTNCETSPWVVNALFNEAELA